MSPRPRTPSTAPDCLCGIYAVENVLDIKTRSDVAHGVIMWKNTALWRTSEMPAVVVGRVTLTDAVYLPVDAGKGLIAPEWRGAEATINELFIPAYAGDWGGEELASLLSKNYAIPVHRGDLPVTKKDKKSKPEWLDNADDALAVPTQLKALRTLSETLTPTELVKGVVAVEALTSFKRGTKR